jgi:hypothetical protein
VRPLHCGRAGQASFAKAVFRSVGGPFFGGQKARDPRLLALWQTAVAVLFEGKMPLNVGLRHESSQPCRQVVGLR